MRPPATLTRERIRKFALGWYDAPSDWMEVFSGWVAWSFAGLIFLTEGGGFRTSTAHELLTFVMSDYAWGAVFAMVGLLHSISLWAGYSRLRIPACLASSFVWLFMGMVFGLAQGFIGAASWVLFILGVLCLLAGVKNAR